MGKRYDVIPADLQDFIRQQHLFFVATAPLNGHVNLSPKGMDSFRILSETRVAYQDFTGSGNETSAHLLENGRITFMFCAFDGVPNILRLYGTGSTILPTDPAWADLSAAFGTSYPGIRQIITADIHLVTTSCGHGIPIYDYIEDRDLMIKWAQKKGADGMDQYRAEKNMVSMDGLPTPLGLQTTE